MIFDLTPSSRNVSLEMFRETMPQRVLPCLNQTSFSQGSTDQAQEVAILPKLPGACGRLSLWNWCYVGGVDLGENGTLVDCLTLPWSLFYTIILECFNRKYFEKHAPIRVALYRADFLRPRCQVQEVAILPKSLGTCSGFHPFETDAVWVVQIQAKMEPWWIA